MLQKHSRHDLHIHLNELPEQGWDYHYTNKSGELNDVLKDLIGQRPYSIEFHLKPIGNAFEIRGTIKTALGLICSRCAIEFEYNVNEPINEILVIEEGRPRGSRSSRTNHSSEWTTEGPFCNYLKSPVFDVAPYIHELVAASEPYQPRPQSGCDENCENLKKAQKSGYFGHNAPLEPEKQSPFSVLADIKLDKKATKH
ncbi:MAG: DUF177 domain-containing protein [Pseudobdellovibrionaceae bacterium]|nr:DUF177 domain-containing protein [Bdellovibrionales bacterium]USN48187.1 MAG: DUF177 domain-containing protein [Pseudobdellovibrionaceae bacterium]